MTQKNETTTLLLTLLITTILIAGGFLIYNLFFKSSNSSSQLNSQKDEMPKNIASKTLPKTLAEVKDVPEGLFRYGGSTTWVSIRQEVDEAIKIVHPQFQLRYIQTIGNNPGSGTGIKMLLDDQLSFSQSSRSLKIEEYQEAEIRGFKLQEIPVGIDGIAIAVNPKLDIPGITISQLKDIYIGKIKNWQELGGQNIPITAYSRTKEAGGTVEFFNKNVMENQEFGNNIEYVNSTTQGLNKVSKNIGGIYYASAPELVIQCQIKPLPIGKNSNQFIPPYKLPYIPPSQCPNQRNQVNKEAFKTGEYPLTRRLFVIIKSRIQQNETTTLPTNLDEIAGLKYTELLLTEQGQDLIDKAGFVPIR